MNQAISGIQEYAERPIWVAGVGLSVLPKHSQQALEKMDLVQWSH